MTIQPVHVTYTPVFQPKNPWDAIRPPVQFRRDVVPQMNVPRPNFFPTNPHVAHGVFVDEMPKPRGTGTYFPITGSRTVEVSSDQWRGSTPLDRSPQPQVQSPGRHGFGRPKSSDSYESSPRGKVYKEVNGFVHTSEKAVEVGAPGHLPLEAATFQERENCRPLDSAPSPASQGGESVLVVNDDRFSLQSYHLKDDEDFPPLSV
ncbi:RNA1 polyprotein [Bienertia sinuspersici]